MDAVASLAGNDSWALSTTTVERLVDLAVGGRSTRVRASAADALETAAPELDARARDRVLEALRELTLGVPSPVQKPGVKVAGHHVDALADKLVCAYLNHHDAKVTEAFVAAITERTGARTDSVPVPDPLGFEQLLHDALENGHETAYAVLVGSRALDALTTSERERYGRFVATVLDDCPDPAVVSAIRPHATALLQQFESTAGGDEASVRAALADAVVDSLRTQLLSDNWFGSRSAVETLFEDVLPVVADADDALQATLQRAADEHAKTRQAMYEHFPALYDAIAADRRRDWTAFLVDLSVDSERTPHTAIQTLPELAARPTIDDATLQALLATIETRLTPAEWSSSAETPGTHVVEHFYALLERRPSVYDDFPTLRENVLRAADTTGVEYVDALLKYDTTAVWEPTATSHE